MTRVEHIAWCKQRALQYVTANDLSQAYASMLSDLGKHPETVRHPGKDLMVQFMVSGHLRTARQMREFIEGFN